MKTSFPGIPRTGLAFLRALKENNNREWFADNKQRYEDTVRQPMLALIEAVQAEMSAFAPAYVGDPAKRLYRIYRDTRFSKDKTPYKTHAGALFWPKTAAKNEAAAFYFAVSPENVAIAAGVYAPDPATLRVLRPYLAGTHEAFRSTFDNRQVKKLMGTLHGETMARTPKGYAPDHPAADILKHKRLVLYTELKPQVATTPAVVSEIVKRFAAMTPFINHLNAPLLKSVAKRRREEAFFE